MIRHNVRTEVSMSDGAAVDPSADMISDTSACFFNDVNRSKNTVHHFMLRTAVESTEDFLCSR